MVLYKNEHNVNTETETIHADQDCMQGLMKSVSTLGVNLTNTASAILRAGNCVEAGVRAPNLPADVGLGVRIRVQESLYRDVAQRRAVVGAVDHLRAESTEALSFGCSLCALKLLGMFWY